MDRFLSRSLLAIAGAGLACLAAEGFARWAWPQFGLERITAAFEMGGWEMSPQRFRPSGELGWERTAQGDERLKSDGFRSSHIRFSDKAHRILFIGDSLTDDMLRFYFGEGAEQRLSRAWGRPVEIWDFAGGGYNIDQYERILRLKCRDFKFDVLVVVFCLNDVYSDVPVVIRKDGRLLMMKDAEVARELVFHPVLFRWSHLYRAVFLQENWRRLRAQEREGGLSEEEAFDRAFGSIVRWTRERNVKLFCVIFPYFNAPEKFAEEEEKGREVITKSLEAHQVPYLRLEDCLPADYGDLYHNEESMEDFIHPNEEGYRKAADCILGFLENRLRS